ncbi:MAG: hypothetical protein IT303_11980 [Dehalococcoidia bacterium]|nr:hypothetical protein [Dehalococcoidia bacterium]
MEQFLYVLEVTRPAMLTDGPTEAEQAALAEHAAYLQERSDEGTLVLAGRSQSNGPETRGIAIFFAEDEAAAKAIMDADPAVTNHVMTASLYPYRVAFGNAKALDWTLSEGELRSNSDEPRPPGPGDNTPPHLCAEMQRALDDPQSPVGYSPQFREYWVRMRYSDATDAIRHCPWCGASLPSSLAEQWFERLRALDLEPEDPKPAELESDEWWRRPAESLPQ